jgi:hypothetical protein
MKLAALILSLALAMPVMGTTIVVPVSDLLFEVPQFDNAPRFNLNQALNGNWTPENPRKKDRKTQKELEKKLIDLMWEEYPDAESIRIWRGNLIIKLPKE